MRNERRRYGITAVGVALTAGLIGLAGGAGALSSDAPKVAAQVRGAGSTRLVIEMDESVSSRTRMSVATDVDAQKSIAVTKDTFVVESKTPFTRSDLNELKNTDGVTAVYPDVRVRATATVNDPCNVRPCAGFDKQYALDLINAKQAWDISKGSKDVVVAVIDTGVSASHPDLAGQVIVGPNYTTDSQNTDLNGHGTHVAGTIAAKTNNGNGVASLGWNTRVMSVKVLDKNGGGNGTDVVKGIRYATDNGADIINMSLAGTSGHPVFEEAINYATSKTG